MIALAMHSGACEFSHFNTNAMLLDETRAKRLLDSGINDITMSIDAVTDETFVQVKRTGSLSVVERNVERILDLRARAGLVLPWVRAKLCAMTETEHEIEAFRSRWGGVADEVQIQEVHNYGGGNNGAMGGQQHRYPCQFWWSTMAVNWNGTVSVCSVDYSGEVLLGDLKRQSIRDIYCGDHYRRYRRNMMEGNYASHPLCARCTVWKVGPDQSAWYKTISDKEEA
jgi:radical SAM protein with 4Fe4S-binding SPASM domain